MTQQEIMFHANRKTSELSKHVLHIVEDQIMTQEHESHARTDSTEPGQGKGGPIMDQPGLLEVR